MEYRSEEFVYDPVGNLIRPEDRLDRPTVHTFDGRTIEHDYDRLQRHTGSARGCSSWQWKRLSRSLSQCHPRQLEASFPLSQQVPPDERWLNGSGQTVRTITTAWDGISRVTSVSDPDSTYTYGYNDEGDVESVDHQVAMLGKTIRFDQTFDPAGNRTQVAARVDGMTDFTTDYTFDDVNRITRIEQAGGVAPKRVDLGYDDASQFTTITRYADLAGTQSVVSSTYTWDDDGRLTGLSHGALASYTWTYDDADRLTQTTSPDGTGDFTYDDTDQLTAADYDYQSDESFTYDANGNRTGGGYTTSTNNQTLSDGTYDYTYDDEGNRTSRTEIATGCRYRVHVGPSQSADPDR